MLAELEGDAAKDQRKKSSRSGKARGGRSHIRSRRWWSGFEVSRSNCPGGGQSSRSLQLSRPRAHGSILAPHTAFMRRMSVPVSSTFLTHGTQVLAEIFDSGPAEAAAACCAHEPARSRHP